MAVTRWPIGDLAVVFTFGRNINARAKHQKITDGGRFFLISQRGDLVNPQLSQRFININQALINRNTIKQAQKAFTHGMGVHDHIGGTIFKNHLLAQQDYSRPNPCIGAGCRPYLRNFSCVKILVGQFGLRIRAGV